MSKRDAVPAGTPAAGSFEELMRAAEAQITASSHDMIEVMISYAMAIATPETVGEVSGLIAKHRLEPLLTVRRVAVPGGWQMTLDLLMVHPATGEPMARLLRWTGNGGAPTCVH